MKNLILTLLFITNIFATTYIGEGYANSKKEAKQNALNDIASQISVKIDNTIIKDKSNIDGKYTKNIKIKTTQSIKANISDYEIIESAYKNGEYFIKIKYENIPSLEKFAKKSHLKKKQIINSIKKDFGKSLGLELVRKDMKWYLKYKDVMQMLDKKGFTRFFKTTLNKSLTINTNKKNNILYEDDEFYFKVKSSKKGYVSILTVYENGTVSVLLKNIPISKDSIENIPDKEFEAIPQAGLLVKGKDTFDMYVAIYSAKKLIFDSFANADDRLIDDERYKNLDELFEFLDGKVFTTLKVVTKHR
jgi:hypothetical protein